MKSKLNNKLISEIGTQEKYLRTNHYNTLKVWWARRPITASRSLLIQEILKRNNKENELIETDLFSSLNPSKNTLRDFRNEFKTDKLNVLDVFSGGASIPFESARLGFKTIAAELNPVASLLQETIFYSQEIENYSDKLKLSGYRVIENAETRLQKYFSINGITPYVLFWSKVAKCKNCNEFLDLRRFEYLSKRVKKPLRIVEIDDELTIESTVDSGNKLIKEFVCKKCNTPHSFKDIKEFCKTNSFTFSPFAICFHDKTKKSYKVITKSDKDVLNAFESAIDKDIEILNSLIPNEKVKSKSGVINPTIYDLKTHKDFFSKRQLLVLLTVIDEIIKEYKKLISNTNQFEAKQIVLGLTSLIEFLVDWNSVSTMWISQNEQTGRSLAGPGVGMKWDFIEINPFYTNGSNLKSKLDRVCATYTAIKFQNPITIIKGSSTNLPLENNFIDIVLTDPPYYDSVDYTGLSEFFRPWFETLLKKTFDIEANLKNQDQFEAIVELKKSKGSKDHNHYKDIMTGVLSEVNRVLKQNGTVLMMYSHKTIEGWQVIADSFKDSNLFITDCIPLEMERSARPRAMAYEALNGVIVFRGKKDNLNITSTEQDINNLKNKISSGVILESQVVIYLAALACKEVTLTGNSFLDCYEEITRIYNITLLEKWMKDDMDELTIGYLEGVLCDKIDDLNKESQKILNHYNLISFNRIKTLDEIEIDLAPKNTIFAKAQSIYTEFKHNSKTKVNLSEEDKESITVFFSILAGTQLNTVSKRTNSIQVKTSRLILSKIV